MTQSNEQDTALRAERPSVEEVKIGKFGPIKVYTDPSLPKDTVIIGYPDGRGGFKDGWVKLTNIGGLE